MTALAGRGGRGGGGSVGVEAVLMAPDFPFPLTAAQVRASRPAQRVCGCVCVGWGWYRADSTD